MNDDIRALEDLNQANELASNDSWTLKIRRNVKRMMNDDIGALKDLNKANKLAFNDSWTSKRRGDVKRIQR